MSAGTPVCRIMEGREGGRGGMEDDIRTVLFAVALLGWVCPQTRHNQLQPAS